MNRQIKSEKEGQAITLKMAREAFYYDCVHTMPAHFENGEKCDGQVSRKRHIFCQMILKTVDFEDGALTGIFWKRHSVKNTGTRCKQNIFNIFKMKLNGSEAVSAFL